MKTIHNVGAQGDVLFVRVSEVPAGVTVKAPVNGRHVLAHSETGHHHTVAADGRCSFHYLDPFTCYLRVTGDFAEVVHHRPFDTHETVRLDGPAVYLVRRQREYTPEGYRRVED